MTYSFINHTYVHTFILPNKFRESCPSPMRNVPRLIGAGHKISADVYMLHTLSCDSAKSMYMYW